MLFINILFLLMGTWGADIFEDDFALDVQGQYLELIEQGLSQDKVVKTLIEDMKEELEDEEESNVFWLALAATQLEKGKVSVNVKTKALEVINSGKDLKRWKDNSSLLTKRKRVLEQLKQKLLQN